MRHVGGVIGRRGRALLAVGLLASSLLGGSLLAGCTLLETTTHDSAIDAAALRASVQVYLAETEHDHQAALDLWDRVIFGEPVSCFEVLATPTPLVVAERDRAAHPQVVPILAELNAAGQAVRNAADLWAIECADERAYVPLTMAREGRAAAVSAGEALTAAQSLLDTWTPEPSE